MRYHYSSADIGSAHARTSVYQPIVDSTKAAGQSQPNSIPILPESVPLTVGEYAKLEGVETMLEDKLGSKSRRLFAFILLLAMLATEIAPIALASTASAGFEFREEPSPNPELVLLVALSSFAEVAWMAIAAICWACFRLHLFYFLSFGVCAASSLGTGIFALAIVGTSKANSVCSDDFSPDTCYNCLMKALGSGLIKILLTAPYCAGVFLWYFFKAKKDVRRAREERRRRRQQQPQV